MIYRIAESTDWQQARQSGYFVSADLAAEGFIHLSELHQVLRTANKYYRDKKDLVLLEIDEALLAEKIIREDLTASGACYPHSYAPIPVRAIVREFHFAESPERGYCLPGGLES